MFASTFICRVANLESYFDFIFCFRFLRGRSNCLFLYFNWSFPFHYIGWNTIICEPISIGENTQGPQSTNAFWLVPRKYTQSLVDFLLKIQNCKTATILMFWQADEIVCLLSALSDSQVPRLASNGLESALERCIFPEAVMLG